MDEKKQIEEMERVYDEARLKARDTLGSMNRGEGWWYSKAFYEAGYRKQSEDVTDINVGNKSEWISVKDRLPEKEEIVLCCLGLVQNVYTYKGDNIWEDSYGYYQKDEPITHWMPLPEPPKGE